MSILQNKIEQLHTDVREMCSHVQLMIDQVTMQLKSGKTDVDHAKITEDLKRRDLLVDSMDVRIEDSCLNLLALQQPVASDLRRLIFAIRVIGHLERVGDLAVSISERVSSVYLGKESSIPGQFQEMAEIAQSMLRRVVEAYDNENADLAAQVRADDAEIDDLNHKLLQSLMQSLHGKDAHVEETLDMTACSRKLERMADHIAMIGEEIIFMVDGRIVRHHSA